MPKTIAKVNHLHEGFYNNPHFAQQPMTTQELQETMMYTEGYITAQGYIWDVQKKSLAPNVWLVTVKRRNRTTAADQRARAETNKYVRKCPDPTEQAGYFG